jgi:ATP-binding cassette, subfamily B, bacterial
MGLSNEIFVKKYPFYKQPDLQDCAPTCLRMIAKYYGRSYSIRSLREKCGVGIDGTSLSALAEASDLIGLRSLAVRTNFEKFNQAPLPCICHIRGQHYIVVYKIERNSILIADPAKNGVTNVTFDEFQQMWVNERSVGAALLLEKTPRFTMLEGDKESELNLETAFKYLSNYKAQFFQVLLGLLVALLFQTTLPFLTQSIVDIGINNQDIGFIQMVLLAQLMFFAGRISVDFIKNWVILYLATKVNLSIVSDFLYKLLKLPMSFFDQKSESDLIQRIRDNQRVEDFLVNAFLTTVFSVLTLIVFSSILFYYSIKIFLIFLVGSILFVLWFVLFLKRKRYLDQLVFSQSVITQNHILEIFRGIGDIKLYNVEREKRWEWESIQVDNFKLRIKWLKITQLQQLGTLFINESKNIITTFTAALLVVDGQITLGMMLSIQYILGNLNAPIHQLIQFFESLQQASLGLSRLNEIHVKKNETENTLYGAVIPHETKDIELKNVKFRYGINSEFVLTDINVVFEKGKVTAIVGESGSGKTTLVKLLLSFYKSTQGEVKLGKDDIEKFDPRAWRANCSAVLQDGFIFHDTISKNVVMTDASVDKTRFREALTLANISDFVERLPLAENTRIGPNGVQISQGQRQRILIARAIYKQANYLFLDESTNALDASNERIVMNNLYSYFRNKTVIVVAHRLSTVQNADKIVVLKGGMIAEVGNHSQLVEARGIYYELIRNQLEIANGGK